MFRDIKHIYTVTIYSPHYTHRRLFDNRLYMGKMWVLITNYAIMTKEHVEAPAVLKQEFVIDMSGKKFVTFPGLLDMAHQMRISSVDTVIIQLPEESNHFLCIMKTTVIMKDGQSYSAHGDASPKNVGSKIAPHIVRMAETRSLARALRFATNIGITSSEELGGE